MQAKAVPTLSLLAKALDDEDAEVRYQAIQGLAGLQRAARPVIPAIRRALRDEDPRVRQEAERLLRNIDPKVNP